MSLSPAPALWSVHHPPGICLLLASLNLADAPATLALHLVYIVALLTLGGALLHLSRSQRDALSRCRHELALRKELLAYLLFNGSPRTMPAADLGRQITRLVAARSSFPRAALLLRNAANTLAVTGSTGFDDLSVDALNRWGSSVSSAELSRTRIAAAIPCFPTSSFTLQLDRRCSQPTPLSSMSCRSVHIVPLRTAHGLLGALAVCTQPRPGIKTAETPDLSSPFAATESPLPIADLLQPIEALALRLTRQLAAPEPMTVVRSTGSSIGPERRDRPNRNPDLTVDRHSRTPRTRNRGVQIAESNDHPTHATNPDRP